MLANGNFETGTLNGWQVSGETQIVTEIKHSGRYAVMLGDRDNAEDELGQFVTIPTDTLSATLSYWWHMTTAQTSHPRDYLYVELLDQAGEFLANLDVISDGDVAGIWRPSASIDLTPYAGQGVWLWFVARTDGRQPTAFYLDDIRLVLCALEGASQPGSQPPKPGRQPSGENHTSSDQPVPLFNVAGIYSDQTGWVYSNAALNSARIIGAGNRAKRA